MRPPLRNCSLIWLAVAMLVAIDFSPALGQNLPQVPVPLPEIVAPQFPGAGLFNDQPPFLTGLRVEHQEGIYREGDKLQIEFQAERDAHLYLLYHQADGSSLMLFPNEVHPDSRVASGRAVIVPPPNEEFRFRIRPPFGNEVLQVLASMGPVKELEALVASRGRAAPVPAKLLTELAARLAADRTTWTEHRVQIRTLPAEVSEATPPPARVGLFIGIGEYQHPGYAPTHEELRHSAEVMHALMLKHGGLDAERTLLVRDSQATKANLQKLISQWLPSITRPGDVVFIYFSGHAGQIPTSDPTETDGLDEAIGPWDLEGTREGESRAAGLARFRETNILDDTLAVWLAPLSGRQVVLILDTCHSGGLAEGKTLKSLFADETARVKDLTQLNTLVLSSCAADEQSLFEGTPNKTMWFTYCLSEAIDLAVKNRRPVSVQDAFDLGKKRLRQLLEQANAPREQDPTMTDRVLLPVALVP